MKKIYPLRKLDGKINVISGLVFDLLNPTAEMITIKDIAYGLAFNSHFNGQSPEMFTVAQHSIEVYRRAQSAFNNPILSMVALLHDAAEAYTGDIIKPIKVMWPGFDELETNILKAIFEKFNLPVKAMKIIKPIDERVQELEYEQFYRGANHFEYLSPDESKVAFLMRFEEASFRLSEFYAKNPDYKAYYKLQN